MKRFKLGVAFFVALFAVGITLAANAGMFKKNTTKLPPTTCTTNDARVITVGGTTFTGGVARCIDVPSSGCVTAFTAGMDQPCVGGTLFCCASLTTDLGCSPIQKAIFEIACEAGRRPH